MTRLGRINIIPARTGPPNLPSLDQDKDQDTGHIRGLNWDDDFDLTIILNMTMMMILNMTMTLNMTLALNMTMNVTKTMDVDVTMTVSLQY